MSLAIDFRIKPAVISPRQGAACQCHITNMSQSPIVMPHPNLGRSPARWFAVSKATGDRLVFQKPNDAFTPQISTTLAPLQTVVDEFSFFDRFNLPDPGEYEVGVELELDGGRIKAASKPQSIRIQGSKADWIWAAPPRDSTDSDPLILWTDALNEGALMMSEAGVDPEPTIYRTVPLEKISADRRPAVSVGAPGERVNSRWVAWLDGAFLIGFRLTGGEKDGKRLAIEPLPDLERNLLAPLLPATEAGPGGAAAVLLQRDADRQYSLRALIIGDSGALRPGPAQKLAPGDAAAGMCAALAKGDRLIGAAVRKWVPEPPKPAGAAGKEPPPALPTLCFWVWSPGAAAFRPVGEMKLPGECVGAAAWADSDGGASGAAISATVFPSGLRALSALRWRLPPGGAAIQPSPELIPIPWQPDLVATGCQLTRSPEGFLRAVVSTDAGAWIWDQNAAPVNSAPGASIQKVPAPALAWGSARIASDPVLGIRIERFESVQK